MTRVQRITIDELARRIEDWSAKHGHKTAEIPADAKLLLYLQHNKLPSKYRTRLASLVRDILKEAETVTY